VIPESAGQAVTPGTPQTMRNPWILAVRPKTLSAAIVPVLMAAALARRVDWAIFACALAGAVLIQIATNLINDAIDFHKGTDTGERLGPVRVTQAGLISPRRVMGAAWVCLFGAALCGVPLILRGGWPMLAIGLASMALAYGYTGGPYPLAYHGLGELFVMLFFGLIAVGGTYYVLTLELTRDALLAGLAAGSLATVLLVINNVRDVEGDRRSEKRTLAVRFGEVFARAEVALFALLPFAVVMLIDRHLLLTLVALPLAIALILRVRRSHGAELNRCLAMAGGLQWTFGLLFVIGCLFIDIA
jgi:1,4-dihydroxy-2-naphthoate octaprenyltransferase